MITLHGTEQLDATASSLCAICDSQSAWFSMHINMQHPILSIQMSTSYAKFIHLKETLISMIRQEYQIVNFPTIWMEVSRQTDFLPYVIDHLIRMRIF